MWTGIELEGDHLGSASDAFVVVFRLYRVCGVFLNLECVESFRGRGWTGRLHVFELVGEDSSDYGLVVDLMRKVHEDGVDVDVRVLRQVNSREVLVLDEDGAMRR